VRRARQTSCALDDADLAAQNRFRGGYDLAARPRLGF
jgi:hypothetical protein